MVIHENDHNKFPYESGKMDYPKINFGLISEVLIYILKILK